MTNNTVFLEIPQNSSLDFGRDLEEACPGIAAIQICPFPGLATTNTSSSSWYSVPASFLELKPAYKQYGYKLVKIQ